MSMDADVSQFETPFFLVGCVRSGTTVLRLMLGHHSRVCNCDEMDYVTPALVGASGPVAVDEYAERLRRDRAFNLLDYQIREDLDFEGVVRDFLAQRSSVDKAPVVGATVHHHFEEMPRIFPEAKYVDLRRDARDVARSCGKKGRAGSAWGGAAIWLAASASWDRLREQVPAENCFELTYERLLEDTVGVMTELCEFLGLQFEPSMLDIEKDTTYSKLNPGVAQSWRESASVDEIKQVEARIGEGKLAASGYQLSGLPALRLTPLRRGGIRLSDFIARTRRRVEIYGLSLWMQGVLSRRLPIEGYRRYVQRKIDAVDNANLK